MKLVVGLGNPGAQYETTRHNIGFIVLDHLADQMNANFSEQKFHSINAKTNFGEEQVLLMKPQTFMNLSGKSVAEAYRFYKCKPEDVIVIHDEIDLPFGALRIKKGGGAGGHNGLRSLDECLGALDRNYYRIRFGVGKPIRGEVSNYVLSSFSSEEMGQIETLVDRSIEATKKLLENQFQKAMNEHNGFWLEEKEG